MFGDFGYDLRYAWRSLRRRPLVSGGVIAAVALGIGATTAIVSVIEGVMLRPLPYPEPDRIVWLHGTTATGSLQNMANPSDVEDWRRRSRSLSAISPYSTYDGTLALDEGPLRVGIAAVGEGMDRVLGVRALHGRLLTADDYVPGVRAIVLAHELWRTRFAADPAVVGRSIPLNGTPYTVVGVLPPSPYPFPANDRDLWLPLLPPTEEMANYRGGVWLRVVGRLAPGYTLAQAQAEMSGIAAQLEQEYPLTNAGRGLNTITLREGIAGPVRPVLLLLAGAVAMVLLIAAANIGNLLLIAAQDRKRDLAIRATLGAASGRLARLVLDESALLAAIGGAIGIALAPLLTSALLNLYPEGLPRAAEIGLNARVLLVAVAATAFAALAAGLPPLRAASRIDLQTTIRAGERGLGTAGERRVRAALVVAQIALSVVLLVGAGLLLRTFARLTATETGITTENVITFNVSLAGARYPGIEEEAAFYESFLERVRALPGVSSAGATSLLPFVADNFIDGFRREGMDDGPPNTPTARLQVVTSGYFDALGIGLVKGRAVEATDRAGAQRVVVVNQEMERRYFDGDALGRRIRFQGEVREIVGVVRDKRHRTLREEVMPDLYVPRAQSDNPRLFGWIAVRAGSDAATLLPQIRTELARLDAGIAIDDVATLQERVADSVGPDRFRAMLIGSLALLALLLAVLGIYGVVAYAVARQTREIGIRMALGEAPARARGRVIRAALLLGLTGVSIGLGIALASARVLESFVAEVGTRDPVTLIGVPLLLLLITGIASLGPAVRASRVDPLVAIRGE